jgi:hypothetical protein
MHASEAILSYNPTILHTFIYVSQNSFAHNPTEIRDNFYDMISSILRVLTNNKNKYTFVMRVRNINRDGKYVDFPSIAI